MQRRLAPVALILPCVLAGLLALARYSPNLENRPRPQKDGKADVVGIPWADRFMRTTAPLT